MFKHTFQAGIDYRTTNLTTETYNSILVDTIDVTEDVRNNLAGDVGDFSLTDTQETSTSSVGVSAQEVLQIGERVRLFGGVRFGTSNRDRKSTRLNSSHVRISYAVFCLKK